MPLLTVQHLTVTDPAMEETLVKELHFSLEEHQCLGIVGESGSGKSITMRAILGLLSPAISVEGSAVFQGQELLSISEQQRRSLRGREIAMILQNPMTAFDPLSTIGSQIIETIREQQGISKKEATLLAVSSLEQVHLTADLLKKYPHQLSGGMLQRVMIAIAMAGKPKILIADEPTTALDSIRQREIVEQFQALKTETGVSLILISHDLGVVQHLADTLLVMHNGRQVAYGAAKELFSSPKDSYTQYLVSTRLALTKQFCEAIHYGSDVSYHKGI